MGAPNFDSSASPNPSGYFAPVVLGTPFSRTFRSLYVGGAGDVSVRGLDGATVTFSSVPAGMILPVCGTLVASGTTTASAIVALF